jgi:hypothetical protein
VAALAALAMVGTATTRASTVNINHFFMRDLLGLGES